MVVDLSSDSDPSSNSSSSSSSSSNNEKWTCTKCSQTQPLTNTVQQLIQRYPTVEPVTIRMYLDLFGAAETEQHLSKEFTPVVLKSSISVKRDQQSISSRVCHICLAAKNNVTRTKKVQTERGASVKASAKISFDIRQLAQERIARTNKSSSSSSSSAISSTSSSSSSSTNKSSSSSSSSTISSTSSSSSSSTSHNNSNTWKCNSCTFINDSKVSLACSVCSNLRNMDQSSSSGNRSSSDAKIAAALFDRERQQVDQYEKNVKKRKAEDISREARLTSKLRVDFNEPAQSLNGMSAAKIDTAITQLHGMCKAHQGLYEIECMQFRAMIEREQELFETHICFYHSYNHGALMYELQSCLASILTGNNSSNLLPPLVRLLVEPFLEHPNMAGILEDFQKGKFAGQDHNPTYRALVICGSMSLFGGQTEAPPLTCFNAGYSCGDTPPFRGLMKNLLMKLGGDSQHVEHVMDTIIAIADSHGIPVSAYGGSRVGPQLPGAGARLTGHMLQLFIKREHADCLAYASQPMGVPVNGHESISGYAAKKPFASGQVRIYMDPQVFTDPSMTKTFHYCAHAPLVSEVVASGVKTRGSMHQEMRAALSTFIGSKETIEKTNRLLGFGVRRPLVKIKFSAATQHFRAGYGGGYGGYGGRFPGAGHRMRAAAPSGPIPSLSSKAAEKVRKKAKQDKRAEARREKKELKKKNGKKSSVWDVMGLGEDGTDWDPFS